MKIPKIWCDGGPGSGGGSSASMETGSRLLARRVAECVMSVLAAAVSLAPPTAASQNAGPVLPLIRMENVPLTVAIENLARQADINYILDPRISGSYDTASARPQSEPRFTVLWTNVTAEAALNKLLQEHRMVIVTNPATSVARIAFIRLPMNGPSP